MDLKRLPKVELHLHLDCSLSYKAVARLAPSVSREEYLRDYVALRGAPTWRTFLRARRRDSG
jgi:adenosine deaminase